MTTTSFKDMTSAQLNKLVSDATAVLAQRHAEETTIRTEFRAELDSLASKWTAKLEAIAPKSVRAMTNGNGNGYHKPMPTKTKTRRVAITKTAKVAPKYKGDDGQTWSGRGKRPRWLADRIAAGAKIEQFRIQA